MEDSRGRFEFSASRPTDGFCSFLVHFIDTNPFTFLYGTRAHELRIGAHAAPADPLVCHSSLDPLKDPE